MYNILISCIYFHRDSPCMYMYNNVMNVYTFNSIVTVLLSCNDNASRRLNLNFILCNIIVDFYFCLSII